MRADTVIRHATIFDGSGGPRRGGDVAIHGDRIAAVGDLSGWGADVEIDAAGLALAPGFIDAHTHDDRAVLCGASCMLCKLSQGVTTVVVGNCGISLSPVPMRARPIPPLDLLGDESWWVFDSFGAYADRLAREPSPLNVVALIGHMSLRVEAMGGDVMRPATDAEAAQMQRRLAEALDQGASGFSTGTYYPASAAAPTAEIVAAAEALRARGGLYVTHMRDEGASVLDAIEETLGIGRAVGVPVVISHHKCANPENYGRSATTLAAIDAGRAAQDVAFDSYPYAAGSTVLMPEKLRADVPARITWSVPHPELAGRFLSDIAADWGVDAMEAARRLLPAGAVLFQMDEADVRRILAHPAGMIGSDGLPHDARPHPRLWGTFPRVLGHYARDENLFSLETAVHKMTGRPAAVFGLADRGAIRPGAYADLVLFDPATVRDTATYDDPIRPADGILRTWINGQPAYTHAESATGAPTGRLLTRGARVIRDARDADLPRILAITNQAIAESTALWTIASATLDTRAAWMGGRLDAGFPVLVADVDGMVAGFGSYGPFRPHDGYRHTVEHSLYVDPALQRRGLGRALLEALIERAQAAGLHAMVGGVEAGNAASLRLHAAAGFEVAGTLAQVGRKFDRWLDLTFVVRLL